MMKDKYAPFESDGIYHVYNRANGNEKLFLSAKNYQFFLKKYEHYIQPLAETYCYCLMPNHFHFLLKIKEEKVIKDLPAFKNQDLPGFGNLAGLEKVNYSNFISKQFSNLFNSYTKAFNKMYQRKGSLFMKPFKRKRVQEEAYLRKLVHYIHYNPVEAGLVNDLVKWNYSSYHALSSDFPTNLNREAVLELFQNRENFIFFIKRNRQLAY
jgi:REP element-mobilizing transposase RayT